MRRMLLFSWLHPGLGRWKVGVGLGEVDCNSLSIYDIVKIDLTIIKLSPGFLVNDRRFDMLLKI